MSDDDLERIAARLRQSGKYQVLRHFEPPGRYAEPDGARLATALAVDVETTGLDCEREAIIQFCGVPFQYAPATGRIYAVGPPLAFLEDPGVEISAEITGLTGLTSDSVRGQRIDDQAVNALVQRAAVVIAHNAKFDRCFLERRLPIFQSRPWACSLTQIPWPIGSGSTRLAALLQHHCGLFFAAHTAEADCLALIHLLATPFASGELPMALLLAAARQKTMRIWAVNAPFRMKDALKARGYRWNSGTNGHPKAWYRDLPEADGAAEQDWLRDNVYAGQSPEWTTETFGAERRYSNR